MDLEDEIAQRINAARSLDKTSRPEDFQLKVGENGSVLINLKTGRAHLIYDEYSKLHDLADLLPDLAKAEKAKEPENLLPYLKDEG